MHKSDQSELQLDRSRLPYSEHLGQIPQEAAQPNIAKKTHYIKLTTPLESWETDRDRTQIPSQIMPPKSRTTRNISVGLSQAESRPTTPHQQQPNQTKGANRMGAEPQPPPRIPIDNANVFIEVLQSLQCHQNPERRET